MLKTTIFHSRIPGRAAMAAPLFLGLTIAVSAQAAAPTAPAAAAVDTIPRVSYDEGEGDPATVLFRRQRTASTSNAFRAYRESKPHPLRAGELFSSGFLTEGEKLPFGTLSGTVTHSPAPTEAQPGRAAMQRFTRVALTPPVGAAYAAGDTLLVLERREAPAGFGEVLVPTGMIRVVRPDRPQALGEVIAVYGQVREGQSVLAAPKFRDSGPVGYQSVANGVQGLVLVVRDPRELRLPHQVLFLNVGRRDGVAPGDLFEARGVAGVDKAMGILQVVAVRERSATVKVINVMAPEFRAGTRVRQVAKLAG